MPIEVELPDGNTVEFPDGTDSATMEAALRRYSFNQPKASQANTAPAKKQPSINPLVYALGQQNDFRRAAVHHGINALHGGAQLLKRGIAGSPTLALIPGAADYARGIVEQDDAGLAKREADYQAVAPETVGTYAGAVAGEVVPWMVGMGELRALGLLPKLKATKDVVGAGAKAVNVAKKGGLLAGEGAAFGASQPVLDGDYGIEKAKQVALNAAVAPLTVAGLKVAGAGVGGARQVARYATPAGRDAIAAERLAKMYGTDQATLDMLRTGSGVPGYQHTVAQVLGTPQAVQAERVMRNNGNTAASFAERESANNLALRDQAARMAGSDADMAAAQEARRQGPGAFWRQNLTLGAEDGRFGRAGQHLSNFLQSRSLNMTEYKILDEGRKIAGQVERGTIDALEGERRLAALQPKTNAGKKALEQATGIINQGMVNPNRIVSELTRLSKSGNKAVSSAADAHLATIGKNQDATGWVHARVLDDVRQNIGKMLAQHSPNGATGSAEGALYGPLKAKIANTIDRAVPGYRHNLAAYAHTSQPINDMEAGRALRDAIDSGARDAGGNQAVSLNHVKALLSKNNRADYPMSPQAEAQANAMLEALQKRSISNNNVAASGPGSSADAMRGFASSPMGQRSISGMAGLLGTTVGGPIGGLLSLAGVEGANAVNNSVMRRVGTRAADSAMTAEAIEAHVRRLQRQKALQQRHNMPAYLLPYITE